MIIAEYIDPKTRQIKQLKFSSEQNYLSWLLESSVRIILKVGKAEKPQLAHRRGLHLLSERRGQP